MAVAGPRINIIDEWRGQAITLVENQGFLSPLAPTHPSLFFTPLPPLLPRPGLEYTGNLGEVKRSIFPSCPYTPSMKPVELEIGFRLIRSAEPA